MTRVPASRTHAAFSLDLSAGRDAHLAQVAGSASALVACAARARAPRERPVVMVTTHHENALELLDDLNTFSPGSSVVYLPSPERTPYDGVRPDRSVGMARAAALSAIDEQRVDFLVTTALGWIRKCVSPSALKSATLRLQLGAPLSVTQVAKQLADGGYTRVPIVEDPGTFAVRGDLIDLWPPGRNDPLRLFMEFDTLAKVRPYDAETQRTWDAEANFDPRGVLIPPTREAILTLDSRARAQEVVRSLCDAVSYPSKKTRSLTEDLVSGHLFLGADAYLPAYEALVPLSDRLPLDAPVLFEDPMAIVEITERELTRAEETLAAHADMPHFPPEEHYLTGPSLDASVQGRALGLLHRLAVAGAPTDGFARIAYAPLDCPLLGSRDQHELAVQLKNHRAAAGRSATLDPLVDALTRFREDGFEVILTARTSTQADRLTTLLEHRGLSISRDAGAYFRPTAGALRVVTAPLSRGLLAPNAGLCLITEEEIFGQRAHRSTKRTKAKIQAALDDLRSLSPGDFVVHAEHGIGVYRGLVHHLVGDTTLELLTVEYQGGDRLLLPVYRLNQIQKFSGESAPKLDRLGGQTFEKTKSKVRKRVRLMADQLLKLYAERKAVVRPPIDPPGEEYSAFEASFPYEETPDQAAAIQDVLSDLQKDTVMDRLVCGDVGFGKTEVALRAAFLAAHCGRQVALLCPTTVLAEQHLRTFRARFSDSGIEVRGLSRFQSKKAQTDTLARLKAGSVDIVIGTHRLLSKDVHFKNLGLLVIDEEQRFGVSHKERLKEIRRTVDVLTLSATPIPRTLNLAVGGLRDMSVIATAPRERRAIRTITSRFDEQVIQQAILRELERGGQVYYVHNRIEGIYERAEILRRLVPEARIAVGHGQMTERMLEKTMLDFVAGEYDVLCATAIVESGLDIPDANTILIDRADLFGLSQLYQIRGRVGRSSQRAYCYLLVPTDTQLSDEAQARISTLEQYTELGSGFHVATMDMELRGAGELLGADQSGFMARVGFELFSEMLEQATTELRGETYIAEVDPELSIDVEAFIPETYVEDIGVRLSLYKRYALAENDDDIRVINEELEDRFGPPPEQARRFSSVMRLKTDLRRLRALGLSATGRTATLHLRDDTPFSPEKLVPFVSKSGGLYSLSPDGRLTRRTPLNQSEQDGLTHADRMLDELSSVTL